MKKTFTPKIKLRKIMKICALQGMIAMTLCSLALAHNNYAQVLDKKITITLNEVSLEEALDAIEQLTNVKFFYSIDQLNIKDKISFKAIDMSLRDILDEFLTPYQVTYKVHEKRSAITLKKDRTRNSEKQTSSPLINPQDGKPPYPSATISGIVTDAASQQPIAGVNIIIKGTTVGTTTDADGKFSLSANDEDILVFSFIGFTTVETQVSGRTIIDIALEEDVKNLNEVIVNAGYWEVKDRERTGNIAKVASKVIENQPVLNPLQAMQGRVAGVYIQQLSGVSGSALKVQIRGINSIANGNEPFYIIDGVPFISESLSSSQTSSSILGLFGTSPLNSINANDIESIEVLKDADATSIYGSRGANGVILITTKRGRSGKTSVDINVKSGFSKVPRQMDLLNTSQYLEMRHEALSNDKLLTGQFDYDINGTWDTTRYTNWQDVLIGNTAQTLNLQASVSGGDKNTQFLFSGAYQSQNSVFPGEFTYRKKSSHFSVSHVSLNKKFRGNFSASYVADMNDLLNSDLTSQSLSLSPNAPELYDELGNLNWENSTWLNPLSYLEQSYKAHTNNLIGNVVLAYDLLSDLEIKTSLGFNDMRVKERSSMPSTSFDPAWNLTSQYAESRFNNSNVQSWIIEPQIVWKKKVFGNVLTIQAGTTFQESGREQLVQYGTGYSSDALIEDLNAASVTNIVDYDLSSYRYNAIFGRINYNLAAKYMVNLTARRDGSSRFGPGKQFANFGAIGAAWIFSEEKFMQSKLPFLSFGKLRLSYGSTGNDQIGDYGYLNTYASSGAYQGIVGLNPSRLYNAGYAWEINDKKEAGLELGFAKQAILFQISYYANHSSNQLVGYPLPRTTGFASIQANLPAVVRNTGFELGLQTTNFKGNFKWNTVLNLTIPQNKLLEFPNLLASTYSNRYVIGEPLSISKVYNYLGVDPQTGIHTVEDMNGDNVISSLDRLAVVRTGQNYYGGINNTFIFKGFQLDVFFQFVKQTGRSFDFAFSSWPGLPVNKSREVLNRWQGEGDQTSVQRFGTFTDPNIINGYSRYRDSNATFTDASFIRLKNISLSYTVPESITKDVDVIFYVQGQNLLTFTEYNGLDPENYSGTTLPPLMTLTAGLQLRF